MSEEKLRVCWNCYKVYQYSRNTSRYHNDTCRVQDHTARTEEIRLAVFKLELDQKSERINKAYHILSEYKEKMKAKKDQ
jgi:hypothetical protein